MGNFYTNYTLRGPSRQIVAEFLAGRRAAVTREEGGCVVVFDSESEKQDQEVIGELASVLSNEFQCPVLAVMNHDDDILWFQLYVHGVLEDEYNSTPGYFDGSQPDLGPSGGDAHKLCEAFNVDNVSEVETILRKSEDYLFAVERHADVARALGIPEFAVGAGYDHLFTDDAPEGLAEGDLLKTDDGVPEQLPAGSLALPGYYKVVAKAQSVAVGWMPQKWEELECAEGDLSDAFRRATDQHREQFKELGCEVVGFKKLKRVLNPSYRDDGGINYLDQSRRYFGQILYIKAKLTATGSEREQIVIGFTAAYAEKTVVFTNNPNPPEPLQNQTIVRVASSDVREIYRRFLDGLREREEQPREFSDVQSLRSWFDAAAIEFFEDRVRRGMFVRMSPYEVAVARQRLRK